MFFVQKIFRAAVKASPPRSPQSTVLCRGGAVVALFLAPNSEFGYAFEAVRNRVNISSIQILFEYTHTV
jgi:hypothetical protein